MVGHLSEVRRVLSDLSIMISTALSARSVSMEILVAWTFFASSLLVLRSAAITDLSVDSLSRSWVVERVVERVCESAQ